MVCSMLSSPMSPELNELLDISLDHLEVLIKHPNYDIRYAAIKILLHRFSGNAYCIATLQEDHEIMEERRRQGKDNGEYNQAFGVYDLAESHGIDLPLRERTNVNSDWTTGNTENRNDILSVQGALDILNGANNERLDLQSFLRDARGVLGRFVESIEEGQGAELLAEMTSARNRSLRSGEQSPEELALSHWRRREAVVIENEDGHGSLEVIMPRESTEREMLDGEQQGW